MSYSRSLVPHSTIRSRSIDRSENHNVLENQHCLFELLYFEWRIDRFKPNDHYAHSTYVFSEIERLMIQVFKLYSMIT